MFANKEEFKKEYRDRMIKEYGRDVDLSHITEKYMVLGSMVREYASTNWKESKDITRENGLKTLTYFSMEFLIGRLLTSNLMNLGIYNIVADGLKDFGIDINELEELESDAGLGNGGLGRLAACFMDSLASLEYAGNGNCLRYQYGFFKQNIVDGYQVEAPDQWLRLGNVWEVRKPKHAVEVEFWGRIEMQRDENGKIHVQHLDSEHVRAVPYDVPVIGYGTSHTNTLRLWNAEPSETLPNKPFQQYLDEVQEICQNVYPDDSTEAGKYLRLKQQYFFVAAGLASLVRRQIRLHGTMDNFAEKNVLQLNDTHPVLAIPELMRILMDSFQMEWDEAWECVTHTFAYTNHTVLAEALEKWPTLYIQRLLPRIYMIIEEINRRFVSDLYAKGYSSDQVNRMAIIKDGQVHMANLAIVGSYSVNGVAALHTDILKADVFKEFYELWPEKFNNKTNGVTHRRWLLYSNPQLTSCIEKYIGSDFKQDPSKLHDLMKYVDDPKLQEEFLKIKFERKQILAKYVLETTGVRIDPNSIFDVQAKRLHAYKRQHLNVMHIIYLYQQLKNNPNFDMYPRTFIFAAKAAPAYKLAKKIIKLINSLADVINNDPDVNGKLKVVFIPNYSVSVAQILMPAADVSEQISTAGKEASGTGNMKFMMNGAITIGTLDGANVEINREVGDEFCQIFGLHADEVDALKKSGTYDAWKYYNSDTNIRAILDELQLTHFAKDPQEFKMIFDTLMYDNDEYMLLADFESYREAQKKVEERYKNRSYWAKTCLVNIAQSGYFSSDRTINEYVDDIWHLEKNVRPGKKKKTK